MFFLGRSVSNLLIWLTAFAMPFQAGWGWDCGCSSVPQPDVTTSPVVDPLGGCCRAAAGKPTCCNRVSDSGKQVCCSSEPVGCQGGCQCGANCLCVDRDDVPTQPSAPAPDIGRSQSVVELALSRVASTNGPTADADPNAQAAETDSAFCKPGTQVCVLLCRFML